MHAEIVRMQKCSSVHLQPVPILVLSSVQERPIINMLYILSCWSYIWLVYIYEELCRVVPYHACMVLIAEHVRTSWIKTLLLC